MSRISAVCRSRIVRSGLLVAAAAAALAVIQVPETLGGYLAKINDSANQATTASYFTCTAAALGANAAEAWPLSETTGNAAADVSGNNRPGTYFFSGVGFGNPGPCPRDTAAGSVRLNGTTGYVYGNTSYLVNNSAVTYELWFRTTSTTGGVLTAAYNGTAPDATTRADRVSYMLDNGRITFGMYRPVGNQTYTITTPNAYNDGNWHMIDSTYASASGTAVFIDGVQVVANSSYTNIANSFVAFSRVGRGNLNAWPNQPTSSALAGDVAQFRRFTTALSATQVAADYAAGSGAYGSCTTASTVPAQPDLYYPMTETTGTTATDGSGNARAGRYSTSGVTYGVAAPCPDDGGSAVSFDGSLGYLVSTWAANNNPQVFTLETWFKTTTTAGGTLIGFGSDQSDNAPSRNRFLYMLNNGSVSMGVDTSGTKVITSPRAYNDGRWHLVAGVASATGTQLYLDGRLVASDSTATSSVDFGTGYWHFGAQSLSGWPNQPTSSHFGGSMARAGVWPKALSASLIADQYAEGF